MFSLHGLALGACDFCSGGVETLEDVAVSADITSVLVTLPSSYDVQLETYLSTADTADGCPALEIFVWEDGWSVDPVSFSDGQLVVPLSFTCCNYTTGISSTTSRSLLIPASIGAGHTRGTLGIAVGSLVLTYAAAETLPCDYSRQLYVGVTLIVPGSSNAATTTDGFSCEEGCTSNTECALSVRRVADCPVPGRPLTMPSAPPLLAETGHSPEWVSEICGDDSVPPHGTISPESWYAAALGEHASVASFSRASLELMSVGAPPVLLEAVHKSALDEIRHARTAFGLARHFGHTIEGPGALPLPPVLDLSTTLPEIAVRTFHEGCASETLAAALARARLAETEAVEADALRVIVEDEARHAALAWVTIKWAAETGGRGVTSSLAAQRSKLESRASNQTFERDVYRLVIAPWLDSMLQGTWPPSLPDRRESGVIFDTADEILREINKMTAAVVAAFSGTRGNI